MAIYKLGDISGITVGKTPSTEQESFWNSNDVSWYTGANMTAKTHDCRKVSKRAIIENKQPITTENSVLFSMVRYIEPLLPVQGSTFNQQIACIEPQKLLNNIYLYYWLEKNKEKIKKEAISGSTFPKINSTDIKNIMIDIPNTQEQQEIIDIIKPIENSISILSKIQKNIEKLETSLIYNSKITSKKFNYHKGGLAGDEGNTTFLNVASANGNPNRYVDNEPNVFIGDVTLSLDGNCGLVNNCLEGYNGYLYKITADNIPNWQVFYSLKTNYSQNIIKLNETGTTIKHASGAKKELVVQTFENEILLQSLFESRIKVYKMKLDLENKLQNTIKLLIK